MFKRWTFLLFFAAIAGVLFLSPLSTQAQRPASDKSPSGFAPNEVLVQFRLDATFGEMDRAVRAVRGKVSSRFPAHPRLFQLRVDDPSSAIAQLEADHQVAFAQPNYYYFAQGAPDRPDDPLFIDQRSLDNPATGADIDAPEAWGFGQGDPRLIVAVLDTGIDLRHADLKDNLWVNPGEIAGNGVDDDGNGFIDDVHGWSFAASLEGDDDIRDASPNSHGTHVAGIIAARGDNGRGVAGVLWRSSLMIVKLFGDGESAPPTSAQIVAAIDYAVANGARIVNGSFAGRVLDVDGEQAVRQSIEDAADRALFVFAAGNQALDLDSQGATSVPCALPSQNIICVGASDPFGNYWRDADDPDLGSNQGVVSVDIAAPGVDILSAIRTDILMTGTRQIGVPSDPNCLATVGPSPCVPQPENYGKLTGTSVAASHVAGVAGLVMAQHRQGALDQNALTRDYIRRIKDSILLSASATPGGDLSGRTATGGLLNARRAIYAFGDSFDDAFADLGFFWQGPTRKRWAVAQNGGSVGCGLRVGKLAGTDDRTVEMTFNGLSSWTLAAYRSEDYEPKDAPQALQLRVAAPDGGDLSGRSGRIAVGVIGRTGDEQRLCGPHPAGPYLTEYSIGGSTMAGVDLSTGRPFIFFNPVYTEFAFPPIDLQGITQLSIAVDYFDGRASMRVSNSINGEVLFAKNDILFPGSWDFTGELTGSFGYYGTHSETQGTLSARAFLTVR